MRIGVMADVYQTHLSGVTNHIRLNKEYFEGQGHQVYVFAFGPKNPTRQDESLCIAPGLPLTHTYYWGAGYPQEFVRLLQSMDIVHVHHPFVSGRLAVKYCHDRGVPLVFTNHTRYDLYLRYYLPWMPPRLGERYLKSYLPGFCRTMDCVISPSQSIKQVLQTWGVDANIRVIPNGVNTGLYKTNTGMLNRLAYGFRKEDVVLVYVGRVSKEKNLRTLFEAFRIAAAQNERIKLLVVGDGPERAYLAQYVLTHGLCDRVTFTGQVEYERVVDLLALADVFVTASISEVMPLTLIEALAAGMPVLGVASPGISDIVQDGFNGFTTREDAQCLAEKIVVLAQDTALRMRLSFQARQSAQCYTVERTAAQLLSLYTEVIAARQAGRPAQMGMP
jgi:1,2-diacylglycerol 3-alpha-glucosyltransferase